MIKRRTIIGMILIIMSLVCTSMNVTADTIQDTSGYCDIDAQDFSNSCDTYYACTDDGAPVEFNITTIREWVSGNNLQIKGFIDMDVSVSGSHAYSMDAYLEVYDDTPSLIGSDDAHWTGITADNQGNILVNVNNIDENVLLFCKLWVISTPEWQGVPSQESDTTYFQYNIILEE